MYSTVMPRLYECQLFKPLIVQTPKWIHYSIGIMAYFSMQGCIDIVCVKCRCKCMRMHVAALNDDTWSNTLNEVNYGEIQQQFIAHVFQGAFVLGGGTSGGSGCTTWLCMVLPRACIGGFHQYY